MLRASSATNVSGMAKKHYPTSADDYELLDVVGQGVSAKVFRALCRPLNEIVAVKTIELEGIHSNLEEIMREAKTMRLAQHSNILSLHCSFVTKDSVLWMVMPYVGGGSVLSIMKWAHRDGLEESCIASILCEVLKAVAYLHKNKFIHRDIKAGNILVDLNGHVKLGDFGVAATMERSGSWGKAGNVRQTFVGTPCWMAPEVMEQIEGYDWHADIWSFGITMLELAHGHAPFAKYPPMKVLLMTLQNEPPKLEESYKQRHFSKAMREVVQLCLQKDPNKRPTAAKLLEHRLFKNAHHDKEFLVKHLLKGLPSLVERLHNLSSTTADISKVGLKHAATSGPAANPTSSEDLSKFAAQQEMETKSQDAYVKGVSSWDFDVTAWKEDAAAGGSASGANTTNNGRTNGGGVSSDVDHAAANLASIKTTSPTGGKSVAVTSPLIKQKTPGAHKSRFKINLDDDDDDDDNSTGSRATSAATAGAGAAAAAAAGANASSSSGAMAGGPGPAEGGLSVNVGNVKKEGTKKGRFWVSGENDDDKDEITQVRSAKMDASGGDKLMDLSSDRIGGMGAGVGGKAQYSAQKPPVSSGPKRSESAGVLHSPRPHSFTNDHALLIRTFEDMTASVRGLCDENEKLKKRNLHLERELTKCQNKLLELQELQEQEEEEEQMKQIERVSSEVISDRDHARHMATANRSLSDKALSSQADPSKK